MFPPMRVRSALNSRYFTVGRRMKGWGPFLYLRNLNKSEEIQAQDTHCPYYCGRNQIRRLVNHNSAEICILPHSYPSSISEVSQVCFRGQSLPISSSSIRPCSFLTHLYKMHGFSPCSIETSRDPYTKLHRQLVNISSVSQYGDSTLRSRSRPYEAWGVTAQCQKEQLNSSIEVV